MDYCQHCQIKLLAEGSSIATIDGNRTRNLPIARLTTPYPLGFEALTKEMTYNPHSLLPYAIVVIIAVEGW